MPPVSDDDAKFCYPKFSPERPSGRYLAKGFERIESILPEGGFKYNSKPSIPLEELTSR
jgi:hypothetical protein